MDLAHASPLLDALKEGVADVQQEGAHDVQPSDADSEMPQQVQESTTVPAQEVADRLGKALRQRDEKKKNSKGEGGLKRPAAALGSYGAKAKAKTTQKKNVPQKVVQPASKTLPSKNTKGKKPASNFGDRDLKMSKKDVYSREYHKIFSDWLFILSSKCFSNFSAHLGRFKCWHSIPTISIIFLCHSCFCSLPAPNSNSGTLKKKKGANLENCKAKARSAAKAAVLKMYPDQ